MIDLKEILDQQKTQLLELKKQYPEFSAKQLSFMTSSRFFAFLAKHYGWQKTLNINVHYTIYVKGSIPEHSDHQDISLDVTGWSKEKIIQEVNSVRAEYKNKMYSNVNFKSSIVKHPNDACYNSEEATYYRNWLNHLDLSKEG